MTKGVVSCEFGLLVGDRRGRIRIKSSLLFRMNEDCSFNFSDTRSSTLPRSTEGSSVPTFSFRKDYKKFPFLRIVKVISQ
jgi:hypothetical protein